MKMKVSLLNVFACLLGTHIVVHCGPTEQKYSKYAVAKNKLEKTYATKCDSIENDAHMKIYHLLNQNDAILGMADDGDNEQLKQESDKILFQLDSLQLSRDAAIARESRKLHDALARLEKSR